MPVDALVPPREWPTLGWQLISWMEHYLCHGPGDVQGDALFFDEEFAQVICDLYRLHPKRSARPGRRVVSYGCVSMPKGRAKSEAAGALVVAEFVGPVRFSHWATAGEVSSWGYEYEAGEPVGKPVVYPFIRCLATEEGQTGNTFLNVLVMIEHAQEYFGSEWRFDEIDAGSTRVFLGRSGRGGEIRPSTAGAASKDGGKETFAVADEIHLYYLPELRSMHDMVRRNCRKRKAAQPWMFATTTMFEPGQGSIAEDIDTEARRLTETTRKRHGFCRHHREGFRVQDWDDDVEQLASLVEAYGPAAEWMDLEGILYDEIRAPGANRADAERYWHNLQAKGDGKAVDPEKWASLARPDRVVEEGAHILIAFDGSDRGSSADDTVMIGWTIEEIPHLFLVHRERRPVNAADYRVNRPAVRSAMTAERERRNVGRVVCDPPAWQDQIDAWDAEFGTGPDDKPIVMEYPTNRSSLMGPAIDKFLEAIDTDSFTHDGSPEMTEYALHAVLGKAKGRGDHPALRKPSTPPGAKIDGLVAAVIGYDELHDVPAPAEKVAPFAMWG